MARYVNSQPSDLYDASTPFKSNESDDEDNENDNEYSITDSLFANPSNALVRRRTNIIANTTDNDIHYDPSSSSSTVEQILHEYTTACQIYGCAHRINAGVLTTFRYRLPSLRTSGNFFDADMLALVEVLLHHINGALSYIKRLDFSLAAVDGKQFGKRGVRSHGAYALAKVLEVSQFVEEVFLPGEYYTWHLLIYSVFFCEEEN